ncbi:MAG TPA: hypothetical protein HA257_02090 [Candidatus Methanoperedenaceae archaeon]|nr:hypothetical protein [Candidatus Methanoperedenaceae archaeon]
MLVRAGAASSTAYSPKSREKQETVAKVSWKSVPRSIRSDRVWCSEHTIFRMALLAKHIKKIIL